MAEPKNQKISFVIVPGSYTTPQCYDILAAEIKKRGYDNVHIVDLPSANDGSRLPPATGEDDANQIRQDTLAILDHETNPTNVVLMFHSYGGVPGSSASRGLGKTDRSAQGKDTAVIGLVYTASFVLPLGQSNRGCYLAATGRLEPVMLPVPGEYMPVIDPSFKPFLFNDLESEEEIDKHFALISNKHSSDSFDGTVAYEAWKYIPSVTLIPGKDVVVPTELQEKMYEDAVAAGGKLSKVVVEGAGHIINVTRPDVVATTMIDLAVQQS